MKISEDDSEYIQNWKGIFDLRGRCSIDFSALPLSYIFQYCCLTGTRTPTCRTKICRATITPWDNISVGPVGFEPTQPKHLIYSQARLSNYGACPLKIALKIPYRNYQDFPLQRNLKLNFRTFNILRLQLYPCWLFQG